MKRRGFLKSLAVLIAGAPLLPKVVVASTEPPAIVYGSYIPVVKNEFASFIFPVVKNTYPSLYINGIIDVQPMNLPNAQVFYMDYVHKKPWYKFW